MAAAWPPPAWAWSWDIRTCWRAWATLGNNPSPITALAAGLASLREPNLLPRRKTENTRIRKQTMAWLQAHGHACLPAQANCFMVQVGGSGKAFAEAMASAGVRIGRSWPAWPDRVRVSVGTAEEMARFREVFAQVAAATA